MKNIFIFILSIFIVGHLFLNQGIYQTKFDVDHWQEVYDHSQYCVPQCEFRGNIDDPELFTLAGYRSIQGNDPTLISPEVQPLTKYFFGISTTLWGNALPAQLVFGALSLVLLYYLSLPILGRFAAMFPPILLALDPLFRDQLMRPFVDLSLTFWTLLYLLFLTRNKYRLDFWWGGLVLGLLALSKSFSYGVLFGVITIIILYRYHTPRLTQILLKIFAVAGLTYLAGYIMFFVHGHTLSDFFLLHYQTLRLYKDYVPEYPKGEIFRLIFSGQWQTWWGNKELIPSPFYSVAWPAAIIASFVTGLSHLRQHQGVFIHLVTIAVLLLFISSRLMFPRYLLPVLPSLYLFLVYLLHTLPNLLQLIHAQSSRSLRPRQ